jgi:hypothetical protein
MRNFVGDAEGGFLVYIVEGGGRVGVREGTKVSRALATLFSTGCCRFGRRDRFDIVGAG